MANEDILITPASEKIEFKQGDPQAVYATLTGSGDDFVLSGASTLYYKAGDGLNYFNGGTGENRLYVYDNANSAYGTYSAQYAQIRDSSANIDWYLNAGSHSYVRHSFGVGTTSVDGLFNVSGGATVLDAGGGYALYFKNAGTQYGAIDTYGGSLSIEAASEAILSGASGVVLKGPGVYLMPTGTSAGDTQLLRFRELAANGTASISLKAPDSISNENKWVLPATIGTADQVLSIASVASTSMTLEWADAAGGGTFGGSLSDNYIPIGTAADTIGNFVLGLTENNSIWIGSDPTSTTDTASANVALGIQALDIITTGDGNVAIGYQAGDAITTAEENVAIGISALSTNATGGQNVAIGREAMRDAVNPTHNVAVGQAAFGFGDQSGFTGGVAIGSNAGYYSEGNYNTYVGYGVGYGITATRTAHSNVGVGHSALLNITSGYSNTALGMQAAYSMTSSWGNVAIGYKANYTATTGQETVAIGYDANRYNNDNHTTAVGHSAGRVLTVGSATILGSQAAKLATSSTGLVALGYAALGNLTTGNNNTALGYAAGIALGASVGAEGNTLVGYYAGGALTTADYNTAVQCCSSRYK